MAEGSASEVDGDFLNNFLAFVIRIDDGIIDVEYSNKRH